MDKGNNRAPTDFEKALALENMRAATASGDTPKDYLYDQADSVEAARITGFVYVTYKGHKYGPARVTWGALDGDEGKLTALINTDEGKWVKLWFFRNELDR